MKRAKKTVLGCFAIFCSLCCSLPAVARSARPSTDIVHRQSFSGTVVKVIDGDSLVVKAAGKMIEVRLYGIDAPEYNQPSAKAAARFLRRLVLDKEITLRPRYYDKYNRLVAFLEIAGRSVNEAIVASGNGWVYPRFCQQSVCRTWRLAQLEAREKRQGLWQEDSPMPPWQWKHRP